MLSDAEIDGFANGVCTDDPVTWWRKLARAIEAAACAERDKRIAELEQRNRDLYQDVQRFRAHALNEKDARLVLEQELEAVRKDAEIWTSINGYEGSYEVSSLGRVRSLNRVDTDGNKRVGRFMTPTAIRKGYLRVSLNKGNVASEVYVHRLVAMAFIENPLDLPQVNHKDGDPANNSVSNLEWVTNQQNAIHAKRVLARGVRSVYGISTADGSRVDFQSLQHAVEAGFVRANIQKCIAGERKKHKGHMWFDAAINAAKEQQ